MDETIESIDMPAALQIRPEAGLPVLSGDRSQALCKTESSATVGKSLD